jgi:hypothetical protein
MDKDVLLDQNQLVLALKDMEIKDIHALNAHTVKLEAELTKNSVSLHQDAMPLIKSNLLSITNHVVDAKLVNSQDSSQMLPRLNALTDHSLFAMTAELNNQLTDIHVTHAQSVKFKIQTISRDVTDQLVPDNMISNTL